MDVSAETLRRTTLGALAVGDRVNLERCLTLDKLLGGHLVSGHVDGVGRIVAITPEGDSKLYTFEVPPAQARYLVEKGSVAIDGVSLTVFSITRPALQRRADSAHAQADHAGAQGTGRRGQRRERYAGQVRRANSRGTEQRSRAQGLAAARRRRNCRNRDRGQIRHREQVREREQDRRRIAQRRWPGSIVMSLMQIPRKIEYALRAMIHLADHPEGVARGTEIARDEQIPKYYLEKVIRDLMHRGLVRARRGPGGGYQLARPADEVTFRDVIEAVEGPITLNVCVDGSSSCALQPTCRMFRVWEEGQRVLLEIFSQTTLKEIAASRPAPMRAARVPLAAAAADKEAAAAKA